VLFSGAPMRHIRLFIAAHAMLAAIALSGSL
jgi:hypothetical protein